MDALMSCGGCLNKTPAPKFDEAAAGGNNFEGFFFFSFFAGNLFKLAESNRIGFGRLVGRLNALGGVDNVNKLLLVRRMRDNALVNEESDVCCCWANN